MSKYFKVLFNAFIGRDPFLQENQRLKQELHDKCEVVIRLDSEIEQTLGRVKQGLSFVPKQITEPYTMSNNLELKEDIILWNRDETAMFMKDFCRVCMDIGVEIETLRRDLISYRNNERSWDNLKEQNNDLLTIKGDYYNLLASIKINEQK